MLSFFDTYAPYRALIDSGLYSHSIDSALALLEGLKQFAAPEYQAAHKGTPFY